MADKRITELNQLTELDSNDVFAVVDLSASETKKVPFQTLINSVTGSIPPGLGSEGLGWARYDDGQYTTSSPLIISGSTSATLPNNGAYTEETYMNSSKKFYEPSTQKIQSTFVGDVYQMVITFKAKAPNANQTHIDLSLTATGATPYDRVSKSLVFAKGNDIWENFYESFHFYADADFVANGNRWILEADGGDVFVGDVIYFIQRTFTAS